MLTGPPGAGKSTVAELVVDSFDPSMLVSGDSFFHFLRRGAVAPWLPESAAQNDAITAATGAATGRLAAGPSTIVFDGIVGPWYLPMFFEHTGLTSLSYAVLLPPVEQCVAGVLGRTGHGFADEDATRQMHAEFASATIDPRHVFANPSGQAEATAAAILAAHERGLLRVDAQGSGSSSG